MGQFRCDDLHHQPARPRLSERPRPQQRRARPGNGRVQPRPKLETGRSTTLIVELRNLLSPKAAWLAHGNRARHAAEQRKSSESYLKQSTGSCNSSLIVLEN